MVNKLWHCFPLNISSIEYIWSVSYYIILKPAHIAFCLTGLWNKPCHQENQEKFPRVALEAVDKGQLSLSYFTIIFFFWHWCLLINELSVELNQGYSLVTTDEGIGLLRKRNSILKPHYSEDAALDYIEVPLYTLV